MWGKFQVPIKLMFWESNFCVEKYITQVSKYFLHCLVICVCEHKPIHWPWNRNKIFKHCFYVVNVSLHYCIMGFHTTDGPIFHREYIISIKSLQVTYKTSLIPINETDLVYFIFIFFLEDSIDLNVWVIYKSKC